MTRIVRLGIDWSLEDRLTPSPAGDLDPAFGSGGVTIVPVSTSPFFPEPAQGNGMALQADGRAVLVGGAQEFFSANDFTAARLLADGKLDSSFGTQGIARVAVDLFDDDTAHAVAIQPDGKIVIAGYVDDFFTGKDFAIVRLTANGQPDPSFGTSGIVTIPFGGAQSDSDDEAFAIAVQSDGKIVVAGSSGLSFAAARLTNNGSLDATFAGKGTTVGIGSTDFGADVIRDIEIQSDGKILLAGYSDANGGQYDFTVLRLSTSGALDTGFGNKGTATVGFDLGGFGSDRAFSLGVQSGGQIVVVGSADVDGTNLSDMAVARLNPNGTPDLTFGSGGKVTFGIDSGGNLADVARSVVIQPDDKIVIAGIAERTDGTGSGGSFAVARLQADGSFDTGFGTGGKSTVPVGIGSIVGDLPGATSVGLKANGKIVAFGTGSDTFVAMQFLGVAPPAPPAPPPPPPGKLPILPTPLSDLEAVPDPVLAGGAANGTAQVLFNQDGGFAAGSTLTFFPGLASAPVRTAVADVNGDLVPDFIGGTGVGVENQVVVFDGKGTGVLFSFRPFEPGFTGGVFVTALDLNGDGKADLVVTPDQGGGPVVAVYDSARLLAGEQADFAQFVRFFGIDDPAFRGGARATIGDINADGNPDLVIAAGHTGGPRISIRNGVDVVAGNTNPGRLTSDFFAFESSLRNGAYVSAGDIDGDGFADIAFGGGPGGGPRVRIVSGKSLLAVGPFSNLDQVSSVQLGNFFAGDPNSRGGVRVLLRDVDGDGSADLTVGSGEGEPGRATVYSSLTLNLPEPTAIFSEPLFGADPLADGVFVG